MQFLSEQLTQQSQQLNALQQREALRASRGVDLHPDVLGAIAGHLQIHPLEDGDRKRLLKPYLVLDQLPKPVKDDNGLAGKAIGSHADKKWLTTHLPNFQKDAMDVARVAASAWHTVLTANATPEEQFTLLSTAIKDILCIATDNAQRLARTQLRQLFDASGAKGAYALMDLDPATSTLDERDTNLLQQAHVEALQELKRFAGAVTPKKQQGQGSGQRRRQNGNGGQWRGRGGGRGGNRSRGRGRGNYNGGGRGGGHEQPNSMADV